jgi:hypothetical protein
LSGIQSLAHCQHVPSRSAISAHISKQYFLPHLGHLKTKGAFYKISGEISRTPPFSALEGGVKG